MATDADYAWAAGFFDGEGCVSIQRNTSTTLAESSFSCRLYLKLTQVDPIGVQHLEKILGGKSYLNRRVRNWKGVRVTEHYWNWYITAGGAADALRHMLPYLILKQERAAFGIEFQEYLDSRENQGPHRLTPEEVQKRIWYYEKMRELNIPPTAAERAAATTKPSGPQTEGCDSLDCIDGKDAEASRNDLPPSIQ